MNFQLYDLQDNSIVIQKEYPGSFRVNDPLLEERSFEMKCHGSEWRYQELYFHGVHIGFGDIRLRESLTLGFKSDFETIEMHFGLKGCSKGMIDTLDSRVIFESNSHNIIYANQVAGEMHWEKDLVQLCEINMTAAFFKRFLPEGFADTDRFRNAMEGGKSSLWSKRNYPINRQMYQLLHDIMHCDRQGMFKRMFLEAKVIELLLLQLEQFAAEPWLPQGINKRDVDKIYAVREYICLNLYKHSSLIDLAHMAGTNEFVLKKGFKELFGTTVFSFWNDLKMEEAKQLLLDHELSIAEVADRMGYKHPRHFSTAFKRKFGILPLAWRR